MPLSIPAFAMVGMGAMVGGGTGAVMTAVTMIFEMTRDYDIVMPMILAVAISVGVRRLLSRENIYTLKLVRRGRAMPKALHANMFLVRHAQEVMDPNVLVLPADTSFDAFLREHEAQGRLQHVVVTQQGAPVRRHPRQHRPAARPRRRAHADDPGRRRQPRLHRRARGRDRLRRDRTACGASAPSWRSSSRAAAFRTATTSWASSPRSTSPNSVASSMKIYPNRR